MTETNFLKSHIEDPQNPTTSIIDGKKKKKLSFPLYIQEQSVDKISTFTTCIQLYTGCPSQSSEARRKEMEIIHIEK